MNLALIHCWKEWRAQRAIVLGYSGLVVACLCLVFLLMPEAWWQGDRRGAISLSWFAAAGMLGVILFVAPGLVRCEFAPKDDQFVRRVPGALAVSFGGKLLFFALASVVLPLGGLVCGWLFLAAVGRPCSEFVLFGSLGDEQGLHAQWPTMLCAPAMLLAPWVWAVGTWLPRGRMALGGALLLALVLGFWTTMVLQQSPHIERGLAWLPWLWYVVPAALFVAFASWTKGRRGGGAPRSAKIGAIAFAAALAPPAGWLGTEVWRYHHPDPSCFDDEFFRVIGVTPELRFALVRGSEHQQWHGVPFRVELATGAVEQIGSPSRIHTPELNRPALCAWRGTVRFWRSFEDDLENNEVFDLATGARTPIEGRIVQAEGPRWEPILPAELEPLVREERRSSTPFRAPGDQRVWFDGATLRFEGGDDLPWPVSQSPVLLQPAGHGFVAGAGNRKNTFDLCRREPGPTLELGEWCWFVRGICVVSSPKGFRVHRGNGGVPAECEALRGAHVLGLFDDDRLLCARDARLGRSFFLFDLATESVRELGWPADCEVRGLQATWPMDQVTSLLPRDPAGRIWLCAAIDEPSNRGNLRQTFVLLDTRTLATRAILPHTRYCRDEYGLLGWPDARTVLMKRGARILRIDTETFAETVLFPR